MKKLSKKKIREAIRVVGHLLETNGTTGSFARNKQGYVRSVDELDACKFCLYGAALIVSRKILRLGYEYNQTVEKFFSEVHKIANSASPVCNSYRSMTSDWDSAGPDNRKRIVEALKSA